MEVLFVTNIFLVLQGVLIVINIITKLADDDDTVYIPRFSFCRELDRKMEHFPHKNAASLKCYLNLILPFSAVLGGLLAWQGYQEYPLTSPRFAISIALGVVSFANCFLFRELDRLAYYLNYLFLILLLIYCVVDYVYISDPSLVVEIPTLLAGLAVNIAFFFRWRELFLLSTKELAEKYTLI